MPYNKSLYYIHILYIYIIYIDIYIHTHTHTHTHIHTIGSVSLETLINTAYKGVSLSYSCAQDPLLLMEMFTSECKQYPHKREL